VKLFKSALVAGIAIVTLISGCVGYKSPPPIIHADNYTAETVQDQQVIPPADKVLGLKEAIRIALTNNPGYKQKRLAIVTAWATFYTQMAGYSPTLSLGFGGTQSQSGTAAGAFNTNSTPWTGGMNSTWNVFNGFQTTFNSLAARDQALSAEEMDRDYRRQLIYLVTTTYNSILQARAQIQIDLSDEAFQEQQLRDGQLKYNAGASSLADLLNFKIYKAQAQDAVVSDTASYKIFRYALAALMGLTTADLPEETQFPPIAVSENQEYSLGVEFYLDLAIAQRPDLKAARLNLNALKYSLYSSWGDFAPTVDLTMGYGYSRANATNWGASSASPRGQDLLYNYGFNVGWDLWKGGSRIANVRIAQAALDTQEETLMQTWINVVQEVRGAYTNLMADEMHRTILASVMKYSLQRRDLIREEYNAGNCDITTLNEAQNILVGNESKHIKAVIGVSNSRAQLDEVCGTNVLQ
jgi:outer membrane protein